MSQVVLKPCVCTHLAEEVSTTNYGGINQMRVGSSDKSGKTYHAILRVNLEVIGAATIQSTSKLELYDSGMGTEIGSTPIDVHRILQTAWTELGACWDFYTGANAWNTGGCSGVGTDYDGDPAVESASLHPDDTPGWQTWTGAALATLIQEAVDASEPCLELRVKRKVTAEYYIAYESDESALADKQPKLTIDYTGGDVPSFATFAVLEHITTDNEFPLQWTCAKTIAGIANANVKSFMGVSEH